MVADPAQVHPFGQGPQGRDQISNVSIFEIEAWFASRGVRRGLTRTATRSRSSQIAKFRRRITHPLITQQRLGQLHGGVIRDHLGHFGGLGIDIRGTTAKLRFQPLDLEVDQQRGHQEELTSLLNIDFRQLGQNFEVLVGDLMQGHGGDVELPPPHQMQQQIEGSFKIGQADLPVLLTHLGLHSHGSPSYGVRCTQTNG